MHPADEFAKIKAEMAALKARADVLRQGFIDDAKNRRSNGYEVVVRVQRRRKFLREKLPPYILEHDAFWETAESNIVTVKAIGDAKDDDLILIEDI